MRDEAFFGIALSSHNVYDNHHKRLSSLSNLNSFTNAVCIRRSQAFGQIHRQRPINRLFHISVPARTAFTIRRDRAEELIHHGVPCTRAIREFTRKTGRFPLRIKELDSTNGRRLLRKHFNDPILAETSNWCTWRIFRSQGPSRFREQALPEDSG